MSYLLDTLTVALGGACLVALEARVRWSTLQRYALLAGATLAVLAGAGSYFEDWRGRSPASWLHEHDFYHYYIGAKYFPELGYMRLYVCTVAALAETAAAQGKPVPVTLVRRLEAPGETLSGAPLATAADACRARFSAARWTAFRADLDALSRRLATPTAWAGILSDLGNNSPPTWNLGASLLANHLALTPAVLDYWPLVDQILLLMLVPWIVWRSFGLTTVLAYLLVYYANPLAFLGWIGGSFQRADWYVALVLGLCALARGRVVVAGLLLALAAAWRVFPALFLVSAICALGSNGRHRDATRLATVSLALIVALVVATLASGGLAPWREFATVLHIRISPDGANTLGLHKLATCWNVLVWPRFVGGSEALGASRLWLETLAGDAAYRQGVTLFVAATLLIATVLNLATRPLASGSICAGLVLLFVGLAPFTYYYAVLALLPLALRDLPPRLHAALLALVVAGLVALRAISIPFGAELGREPAIFAVSLHSSRVLLLMYCALAATLAAAALRAHRAVRLRPCAALVAALLAALTAVYGYRATPVTPRYFHPLDELGTSAASVGVTLSARPATASWPAAHFFEVSLSERGQTLHTSLTALPAGRYRVTLFATSAPGYGRVSVTLGRRHVEFDGGRADGRAQPIDVTLGEMQLDASSSLVIKALDATGARIGLSGLKLEPLPAF